MDLKYPGLENRVTLNTKDGNRLRNHPVQELSVLGGLNTNKPANQQTMLKGLADERFKFNSSWVEYQV